MDELRVALELASDDELLALTDILFRRKFNPLDYVYTPEPIDVQSRDRQTWLDALEERFRFLAADGMTVLRGKADQVSYRQILIRVCRYLKLPYKPSLSTDDLEAEIFLHLLDRAWKQLPKSEQKVMAQRLRQALSESELTRSLPAVSHRDPMSLLLKGGGALAVGSIVRPLVLQLLTRQFAIHAATYQLAQQTLVQGGMAIATQVEGQMALRGMALSTARFAAARSVFALLGPAMWMWFFADLGWRSIATNYGRVIPVVFTLAQIRLTRNACWEAI